MVKPIVVTEENNTKIPTVLVTKCEVVTAVASEIKQLCKDLIETANSSPIPAAGLSAPQVGVSKRVCLVKKFKFDPSNPNVELVRDYILINPEITNESKSANIEWEGCLSIPELYGRVQRADKISVVALNENGEKIKLKAHGYFARVIQHEVDHLNGILFSSKVIGKLMTEHEMDKVL